MFSNKSAAKKRVPSKILTAVDVIDEVFTSSKWDKLLKDNKVALTMGKSDEQTDEERNSVV